MVTSRLSPQLHGQILQYFEEWKSQTKPSVWVKLRKAEPIACHFGLGMWIRNTYLLKDEEIRKEFRRAGYYHGDDMSHVMLEIWIEEINNDT